MNMLDRLIKLRDNLELNWPYFYRVIFTFAFYLIYKAFLKVLNPEDMSPFILIFIVLGVIVFTIDKLIYPIVDIFTVFKGQDRIDKHKKQIAILVIFLLSLSFIATIGYYITNYYPIINLIIFSLVMASSISSLSLDYSKKNIVLILKLSIAALSIIGIAGIIHSYYLNKELNMNTFMLIFILGFFVLDYISGVWKKKYKIN